MLMSKQEFLALRKGDILMMSKRIQVWKGYDRCKVIGRPEAKEVGYCLVAAMFANGAPDPTRQWTCMQSHITGRLNTVWRRVGGICDQYPV